jgi:hypothetical protein
MKETVAVSIIMVSTVIHLVHLQSLVEEVDMTMDQTFMLQVARTRLLQKLVAVPEQEPPVITRTEVELLLL